MRPLSLVGAAVVWATTGSCNIGYGNIGYGNIGYGNIGYGQQYDFFRNLRYPGGRRPGVSLDRIEQKGGPDAAGTHNKRVVHWWPKRGVDIVEAPQGAPLRTWTIRSGQPDPPNTIRFMRSAARNRFLPDLPLGIIGFRMVPGPELEKAN